MLLENWRIAEQGFAMHNRRDDRTFFAARMGTGRHSPLLVATCVLLLVAGCFQVANKPGPAHEPSDEPVWSPYVLAVESVPLDQALQYFDDELSQLKLNTYEDLIQRGANGWFEVYKAGPDGASLHSGLAWIVGSSEPLVGYLIVQNGWRYAHDLGIIFTLDYRQAQLAIEGEQDRKPIYVMQQMYPGEQRALSIRIPPLAEGVHQLTAVYVPDALNDHPDISEYVTQLQNGSNIGMSILSMSSEEILAQVSTELVGDRLPRPLDSEYSITNLGTRPFRPEEIVRITLAMLSKSPSPAGGDARNMMEDWLQVNEVVTYSLKLLGCSPAPYQGDVPIQIGVFWDDVMYQSDRYNVPANIPCEGRSIPVTIQAPPAPGEYTLMVVVYPYPGYSLVAWSGPVEESFWEIGAYAHIATRAQITVVSPGE